MNIIEESYRWARSLEKRGDTRYIVLHHRAGSGTAQGIHSEHLANGWAGIGYHFYVRKDGRIYRGRPIDTVGAHCTACNRNSVGVCFEGNFQKETMTAAQLASGRALVSYLKGIYPSAAVKKHNDFDVTACPGRNFPFEDIAKGAVNVKKELTSANDIIWELANGRLNVEISDVANAVRALAEAEKSESPLYWILRKIVNK